MPRSLALRWHLLPLTPGSTQECPDAQLHLCLHFRPQVTALGHKVPPPQSDHLGYSRRLPRWGDAQPLPSNTPRGQRSEARGSGGPVRGWRTRGVQRGALLPQLTWSDTSTGRGKGTSSGSQTWDAAVATDPNWQLDSSPRTVAGTPEAPRPKHELLPVPCSGHMRVPRSRPCGQLLIYSPQELRCASTGHLHSFPSLSLGPGAQLHSTPPHRNLGLPKGEASERPFAV